MAGEGVVVGTALFLPSAVLLFGTGGSGASGVGVEEAVPSPELGMATSLESARLGGNVVRS